MHRTKDDLVSVIPELKIKSVTWDVYHSEEDKRMPKEGDYLVSIGRNTNAIGSVYQVATVREVQPKIPRPYTRYVLGVIKLPEMKEKAHYNPNTGYLWMDDTDANVFGIEWYARGKNEKKNQ